MNGQPPKLVLDQDYHAPEDKTLYYPQRDLLFYVEHGSSAFDGTELTTADLLAKMSAGYDLPSDVDPKVPAVRLPVPDNTDDKPGYTVFCVRSPTLDVTQQYLQFYRQFSGKPGLMLNDDVSIIRSVLPNWFSGIAPHSGIGSHGPGGPPRPVINPQKLDELNFDLAEFIEAALGVASGTPPHSDNPAQKDVVVYILDTLPSEERICGALDDYPDLEAPFKNILPHKGSTPSNSSRIDTPLAHYLYVSETGTNFDETYISSEIPNHFAVGDHDYDSSDHGLFIAGIVHLIAPKAKIYVIQVINDNGVGTFQNYTAGFKKIVELHQAENSNAIPIVNCSFVLSIPIDGHDGSALDATLAAFEATHQGFKAQIDAFRDALNGSLLTNATVFAASGNDSTGNGVNRTSHKLPRYPAQFENVIGVGSVTWNRQNRNQRDIADYSNQADKPNYEGFYVYGGQFDDHSVKQPVGQGKEDYDDGGDGVISIFTGDLDIAVPGPGHSHDEQVEKAKVKAAHVPNGYAEWKGTSFATPVVAGMVAYLISEWGETPVNALNLIDQNCDKSSGLRKFKFGKQRHP